MDREESLRLTRSVNEDRNEDAKAVRVTTMKPVRSLARLSIRQLENRTEYATNEFVEDSLKTFEAKYSLPVKDAIEYLRRGKVDSISLNKEKPYANFHATRFKERILVSIREASKDVELELPIQRLVEDTALDSD